MENAFNWCKKNKTRLVAEGTKVIARVTCFAGGGHLSISNPDLTIEAGDSYIPQSNGALMEPEEAPSDRMKPTVCK